jgi:hypothetical protein
MKLWAHWYNAVLMLRPTCARMRTFLWFVTCLAGITIRIDFLGVTSIVRALGLKEICYDRILDFYHGTGLKLDKLTHTWVRMVLKIFINNPILTQNPPLLWGIPFKPLASWSVP